MKELIDDNRGDGACTTSGPPSIASFDGWRWYLNILASSNERPFWPPIHFSNTSQGWNLYIFFRIPFCEHKRLIISRQRRWSFGVIPAGPVGATDAPETGSTHPQGGHNEGTH